MMIAIDFDGVICQHKTIPSELSIDNLKPIKNAIPAIKLLQKHHILYVLTNRYPSDVVKWLNKNGFKKLIVTDKKLPGTSLYLDDRAYRFTNWEDVCKLLV